MKDLRKGRVSSFLREEIADILHRELRDPRIGFLTITQVEPTADLREAEVRVSILGSPADQRKTLRGLEDARVFIQRHLATRHRWRHTPVLRFVLDESFQKQTELDALLKQARDEDEAAANQRQRSQSNEVDPPAKS
ncbi:MAG: 30S ribosome-binding factor RbfA [Planctomycetota bacterium]